MLYDTESFSLLQLGQNAASAAAFPPSFLRAAWPSPTRSIARRRRRRRLLVGLAAAVVVALDQLDINHVSVVPLPRGGGGDSGVAAGPVSVALRGLVEDVAHQLAVVQKGLGEVLLVLSLSALELAGLLGPGDDLVDVLDDGLGLLPGGLDAAVAQELRGEAAHERLPLVGGAREVVPLRAVPHGEDRAAVADARRNPFAAREAARARPQPNARAAGSHPRNALGRRDRHRGAAPRSNTRHAPHFARQPTPLLR
mmetsp:Transcript_194/g.469  ORF Transcript_194/g.469 Transcript_194/m.469 type:complete len:254 (+) Transcript_194:16-777(+)